MKKRPRQILNKTKKYRILSVKCADTRNISFLVGITTQENTAEQRSNISQERDSPPFVVGRQGQLFHN